ncbi:MAG: tetratricopeptide repeat protein [Pirellulaceae bacterium]
MDRFPLRTAAVWGWVAFGVLMLPAGSDVASPQIAVSASSLARCAATTTDRAGRFARDSRDNPSHFRTSPVMLVGHLFAPPPLPTVTPSVLDREVDSDGVEDHGPVVQLAPVLNPAAAEPCSSEVPIRRLPQTGPLMDDTIDRLPPVEPGILPCNDEVMQIEREVPDDNGANSIHLLPPVLEDDMSVNAPQTAGPSATDELRRLPVVVPDEKPLLGSQTPPADPLMHHLPSIPSAADRDLDLALEHVAGGREPVPLPVRPLDGQPASDPPPLDDATRATLDRNIATIIQRADDLAARGALFAARAEMLKALSAVTQALDANEGVRAHSEALGRSMRAFHEANDIAPHGSQLESELDLEQVVSGHRTPVLKNENVDHLTPIAAQQRYLEYAQQQLAVACGHVPAASQALYVLARIYTALDNSQLDPPMLCLPQAVALHRAALAVDPHNGRAANELGVLLARFGQWENARQTLLHGVAVLPSPETWHNLSVVHEQLGQLELARRASDQSAAVVVGRGEPSQDAPVQSVHWVDPQTFSAVRSTPEP